MRGTPRIEGARERWSKYRNTMTDYLLQLIERDTVKGSQYAQYNLLILGAGGCDDIDISYLLTQGIHIWLVDVNMKAVRSGLNEYEIDANQYDQIHIIEADLTDISESEYQSYTQACMEGKDYLAGWWKCFYHNQDNQRLKGFKQVQIAMRREGIKFFDVIVTLGLHSQLYIELIRRLHTEGIAKEVAVYAMDCVKEANEYMAIAFYNSVREIGKHCVMGLEYTSFYPEGEDENRILDSLMRDGSNGLYALDVSRVEGACQMEQVILREHQDYNIIRDRQYVLWPFWTNKTYLMVIYWLEWKNVIY